MNWNSDQCFKLDTYFTLEGGRGERREGRRERSEGGREGERRKEREEKKRKERKEKKRKEKRKEKKISFISKPPGYALAITPQAHGPQIHI